MAKVYTEEELNNFSRETLMAVILSMQDQIHQLNTNMERLIEQIADANNKRYGRSSEKLETISGQLELELIFNEAEALTETLYVVEPVEEDVIQPRRKNKGKREADLKDLPIEVIVHTLSEEKLQDVFGTDGWKQLPDEIYKRVRVQPAVYTVEEHHVAVYAGKDNQTIIKADHPEEFLKDFKGIVVCDGYSAYRKLDRENPDIVFAGCWSHARRRFAEALKALPKAAQKNAKETVAYEAVSRIAAIYHLDNQMEGQPAKVRKMYRQANIRPLVEAFFAWAKEIQIKNQLSRGKTLDGINYCINQEVSLKAFLEDGDIPMDNNATESALRSFCLHKHTWKLIDSLDGANASAIIYSITETAKANNLNPFRYLEHVLTVVLLSHKKPDSHINVKVEFGEGEGKVPLKAISERAEAYKPKERVTYKMIKEYIEAKYGFKVHTAYIAEVKRDLGLPMYDAPNAVEELKQPRKHPTAEKVEAIKDALKHFEVI